MDHCQNGCPCESFDCDLALNVTDPVYGLESIGILEPIGEFHDQNDGTSIILKFKVMNTLLRTNL